MKKGFITFLTLLMLSLIYSRAASLNTTEIEWKVFQIVNQERAAQGLSPLKLHIKLSEIARLHSANMIQHDFFSHTDHQGKSPFDRLKAYAPELVWNAAAENIAYNYGNSEDEVAKNLMTAWMNSPGHRANILGGYSEIGIGIVGSGEYYYATQVFTHLTVAAAESDFITGIPATTSRNPDGHLLNSEGIVEGDYKLDTTLKVSADKLLRYDDKLGYRISYPSGWSKKSAKGWTIIATPDSVSMMLIKAAKNNSAASDDITAFKALIGQDIAINWDDAEAGISVGFEKELKTFNAEKGYALVEYTTDASGQEMSIVILLLKKDKRMFVLAIYSPKNDPRYLEAMGQVLGMFKIKSKK